MTISTAATIEESLVRKSSYNYEDLLECGHGNIFGKTNGRLPTPPMLMTDRVTLITDDTGKYGKGEIKAELDINPDLWFFDCHFEDDPVMPGCLGLDALWQLLGFHLVWGGHQGRGRALGCGKVKFTGQVLPKARLVSYRLILKRILVSKLVLGVADGTVEVDGRLTFTAKNLKVGLFTKMGDQEPLM